MSQQTKITEAELIEIKTLQNKFQEIIFKLGNLGVEKIELDRLVNEYVEKEKRLKEEWSSLRTTEQGLLDKISKTYGDGELNMTDGTFKAAVTPSQTV